MSFTVFLPPDSESLSENPRGSTGVMKLQEITNNGGFTSFPYPFHRAYCLPVTGQAKALPRRFEMLELSVRDLLATFPESYTSHASQLTYTHVLEGSFKQLSSLRATFPLSLFFITVSINMPCTFTGCSSLQHSPSSEGKKKKEKKKKNGGQKSWHRIVIFYSLASRLT